MTQQADIPALDLAGVRFGFGGEPVLDDVTLRIAPGEMVAVIGPNGAGKSTLLRLIAGIVRTQAGTIQIQGARVETLSAQQIARRIAVVPQDFSVQFAYSTRQVVALGRMPHQGAWQVEGADDRRAVAGALAAVGLEQLAERPFNDLSGGERQRAVLALAFAQDTPIVLLDEPTAHLDVKHQVAVLSLLRDANRRGATIVATLHDLNIAARVFPRLVLLQQQIVADGPPEAVLREDLLARVYEASLRVVRLPGDDRLTVLPQLDGEC
jgi:iron complex transport system ATP-binding protein